MKKLCLQWLLLVGLGSAFSTYASNEQVSTPALAQTSPALVIESMEQLKSKSSVFATARERRDFLRDANQLSSELRAIENFEQLTPEQNHELAKRIDALHTRIVTATERSKRRICERVRRVGSNLTTTVCQTQAEIDRAARQTELKLMNVRRPSETGAE